MINGVPGESISSYSPLRSVLPPGEHNELTAVTTHKGP